MAGATAISANDLAGLLSDAWALSETGVQSIAVYLELLRWGLCAAFNGTPIPCKAPLLRLQEGINMLLVELTVHPVPCGS